MEHFSKCSPIGWIDVKGERDVGVTRQGGEREAEPVDSESSLRRLTAFRALATVASIAVGSSVGHQDAGKLAMVCN